MIKNPHCGCLRKKNMCETDIFITSFLIWLIALKIVLEITVVLFLPVIMNWLYQKMNCVPWSFRLKKDEIAWRQNKEFMNLKK